MIKNIKVGGIDYTVEFKELEAAEGTQFGYCFLNRAEIQINKTMNDQKQKQTIIHEMTHAMFHECGLDDMENEEDVVNRLSNMLHQVLQDNDFSWLRSGNETEESSLFHWQGVEKVISRS